MDRYSRSPDGVGDELKGSDNSRSHDHLLPEQWTICNAQVVEKRPKAWDIRSSGGHMRENAFR